MNKHPDSRRRLRRSMLVVALGLAFASGAVYAQQTVGTIFGTADPGATIQLTNVGNGATRTITAGANGTFDFTTLRPGQYKIVARENGRTVTRTVSVIAAQGTSVNLTTQSSTAEQLSAVNVTATALPTIDINSAQKTTILTAQQMAVLPVPRNESAIALLAPQVTAADPSIPGAGLTIFGSSAAENSYYVNGFPVVSQFRSLDYTRIPFQAIAQEQIKTGGYGAKFGYATGGVISVVTKRGSNTWHGGIRADWTPNSLRGNDPDVYKNSGNLLIRNSKDETDERTYSAWVSGPLVKNKLFLFGLVQQQRDLSTNYGAWSGAATSAAAGVAPVGGAVQHADGHTPFYLVKLDWNISDNNILEYTGFGDNHHAATTYWFGVFDQNGYGSKGNYQGTFHNNTADHTSILKYTGYISSNLTVTAQWGRLRHTIDQWKDDVTLGRSTYGGDIFGAPSGCPEVIDDRPKALSGEIPSITGCAWGPGGLTKTGASDERTDKRIDVDWIIGNHDLTFGYDDDHWSSNQGSNNFPGGIIWIYESPTVVASEALQTSADVTVKQRSFYAEDHWQLVPNFMLELGLRNDSFQNLNGSGAVYVHQDNIWQPRLGFSWNVLGDSTFKIYGTAGLYSLPVSADVALRGAAASTFFLDVYNYTGINPVTGAPEGTTQLVHQIINGESGTPPPAGAVASQSLKPIQQREFTLGLQKQLWNPNWVAGIKLQENELINTIDDTCDWHMFQLWGQAAGVDVASGVPSTMPGCWIINPGQGATFNIDVNGDGNLDHPVLTTQMIGEPKARRKSVGVTLTLTKQWGASNWFMRASYAWLHNYGNTEGLIKSDFNAAQLNTGTTQDFDFPLLMVGAYGNLPNDRRSTFKLYGAWRTNNHAWTFSGNVLVQSGRPKNCFGVNPEAFQPQFASVAAYMTNPSFLACHGEITPRGSLGYLPTMWSLDLGVAYRPPVAPRLKLALYVTNVFNRHTVIKRDEGGETASDTGTPGAGNTAQLGGNFAKYDPQDEWTVSQFYDSTYGIPLDWQMPRTVRFTVEYAF